ncbi:MAG: hypothetical protein HZA34_01520 [Candidatus Pacebacteria bacterium]|nr:hypothetical protein [Candidatus Paceibacterota bacterium]
MKHFGVWILGLLLTLLTLRPLVNSTFFPVHDFTHVARLVEMDRAIADGHFPVRWVKDLGFGYGMPLFSFYGPMPFYLAEGFYLLGFSSLVSIKLLLFAMFMGGYWGMYLLSSRYMGKLGGVVAATAFLLIPYRAVDVFVRGAFNELFAITLVPWIMYGFIRLRETLSWKWTAGTSALLFLFFTSHNLMTMMFSPIIYGCGLLLGFFGKKKILYWTKMHLSLLLGIGAASFYILPSFFEKGYTQVDKLIGGYGAYTFHFLYIRQLFTGIWGYGGSILGPEDGLSFQLGTVHIVLTLIGFIALFLRSQQVNIKLFFSYFAAITLFALFMTIFKSQFLWDKISLFQYFQFPWRFLSVSTVFLPVLSGAVVMVGIKQWQRITIAFISVALLLGVNLSLFQPVNLLEDPRSMYYEDPKLIQSQMSEILPDYIPVGMSEIQKPFQRQFEVKEQEGLPLEVLVDRTHEKLLRFKLQNTGNLLVRVAWFPRWTVYDNGKKISFQVQEKSGFIEVPLEEGDHVISVKFEDTPLRMWSNVLSTMSLFIIGGVLFYDRHQRRPA